MYLQVDNLSMTYDKKVLYNNASFRILPNEKVGIVGANGVGKSTLIKILGGEVIPDSGNITFQKDLKVGYLDQYASVNKKITINAYLTQAFAALLKKKNLMDEYLQKIKQTNDENEQIRLARSASIIHDELEANRFYEMNSMIMKVATGLGIVNYGMTTEMGKLSGGQKVKVVLAKLLLENPDLIILDEPTNFLDESHVEWLVKYLKEYKGSFLIVSHNQEFLDDVVNVILDIEFGKITKYKGNYKAYLIKKAMMVEDYERRYNAQQKEKAKLQDYIDKNRTRASTAKMAQSRQKKLDKMEVMEKPKTNNLKLHLDFKYQSISSHRFLVVDNLEIGYYYSLLPPISFEIKSGEKLAIMGFNGIGKSTLLKTLIGELKPIKGTFKFVDDAKIAYFEQEHHFENVNISPFQMIAEIYPDKSDKEIRSELAKCAIQGPLALQPIKTMSGGEQSKLKLCLIMLQKANVLILDEPTNHLDALAKESLMEALKKYPGTVIFVSHEKDFVKNVATKVYNIEDLLIS